MTLPKNIFPGFKCLKNLFDIDQSEFEKNKSKKIKIEISKEQFIKIKGFIELFEDVTYRLNNLENFSNCIKNSVKKYKLSNERWEKKASTLLKEIGVTSGKRMGRINNRSLLIEYSRMVIFDKNKHNSDMSKMEAIEYLKNKYKMQSNSACYQRLKKALSEQNKKGTRKINKILPAGYLFYNN